MISPTTIAPTSDPTKAPTTPPQKRSGRKIVKCQIAKPIITQPSIPISGSFDWSHGSSLPSARPPVAAVARTPALLTSFGLVLEHQILRRQVGPRIARLFGVLLGLSRHRLLRHAGAAARSIAGERSGSLAARLIGVEGTHGFLALFS